MPASTRHAASARRKVAALLAGDLSFNSPAGSAHPLHTLHPFAARFPHGLAARFISDLTQPGQTVLDPMCGSGATLLDGWLAQRNVIGVDLDPLARRQSVARTSSLPADAVTDAGDRALRRAADLHSGISRPADPLASLREQLDAPTLNFLDYWFLPETQRELAALVLALRAEPDPPLRNLLAVVFSSTIVTKSGGVSRARDLAHTRPHRVADKLPRRPIPLFRTLLRRAADAYAAVNPAAVGSSSVIAGDSRRLPLADASIDLIVTSPPYANALDYMRAHKFSLAWLGHPIPHLTRLRSRYIGAERHTAAPANADAITKAAHHNPNTAIAGASPTGAFADSQLPPANSGAPSYAAVIANAPSASPPTLTADLRSGPNDAGASPDDALRLIASVISQLTPIDPGKARILQRYFNDLSLAIREMARVLRPGAPAIIVVGPSQLRGRLIPTHQCLAELATAAGLDLVKVAPRPIARDRRMMPARNGSHPATAAGIERRMHTEYIIGAVKPSP